MSDKCGYTKSKCALAGGTIDDQFQAPCARGNGRATDARCGCVYRKYIALLRLCVRGRPQKRKNRQVASAISILKTEPRQIAVGGDLRQRCQQRVLDLLSQN